MNTGRIITKISFFAISAFITLMVNVSAWGQLTSVVEWNFPNDPDDAIADGGIPANSARLISTSGTNTPTFNTAGATTNSARAIGWDNGSGTKYWTVNFSTSGYKSIRVSSKQRSSTAGPRDFKLQYSLDNSNWIDVSNIPQLGDNYTSGTLSNVILPSSTENLPDVYLRWIMTSNTAVNGSPVTSAGISNIDDIVITGIPFGLTTCTSVLINEIDIDPPSTDDGTEYVEIRGIPGGCIIPDNTYFVALDGDTGSTGMADFVVNISNQILSSNGILFIKGSLANAFATPSGTSVIIDTQLNSNGIENGTNTFLVVTSTTAITEPTDYDTNDDGTLDGALATATILDSIAVTDSGVGDITYAPVLSTAMTGITGVPDALSRLGGNNTANSASSYFYGDLSGATSSSTTYNPSAVSASFPSAGALTPGSANSSPSAASATVGGRVTEANGRGIFRARVTLIDSQGIEQTAYTNTQGYYSFPDVPGGQTYIFTVRHLRYQFAVSSFVEFVDEDNPNINFVSVGESLRPANRLLDQ